MNIEAICQNLLALATQAMEGRLTELAINELSTEVDARLRRGQDSENAREATLRSLNLLGGLGAVSELVRVSDFSPAVLSLKAMAESVSKVLIDHRRAPMPGPVGSGKGGERSDEDLEPREPATLSGVVGELRAACDTYQRKTFRWRHQEGRLASAVLKIILNHSFDFSAACDVAMSPAQVVLLETALDHLGWGPGGSDAVPGSYWDTDAKTRQLHFSAAVNHYQAYKTQVGLEAPTLPGPAPQEDLRARVDLLLASEAYRQETYAWRHKKGHAKIDKFQVAVANPINDVGVIRTAITTFMDTETSKKRHGYMDAEIAAYFPAPRSPSNA